MPIGGWPSDAAITRNLVGAASITSAAPEHFVSSTIMKVPIFLGADLSLEKLSK